MAVLIGICGKMGSGKDYIASKYIIPFLQSKSIKCLQLSSADQIKVNIMAKTNVSFNEAYLEKNQKTRQLLQHEGTENGRNIQGKDIWIKYFEAWHMVLASRGIDAIITSDVRFKNEMEYIKNKKGLLIKVVAPNRNKTRLENESQHNIEVYKKIASHASECELDDVDENSYDLVIRNDYNDKVDEKNLYDILNKL